jgi:hypothetical protein
MTRLPQPSGNNGLKNRLNASVWLAKSSKMGSTPPLNHSLIRFTMVGAAEVESAGEGLARKAQCDVRGLRCGFSKCGLWFPGC